MTNGVDVSHYQSTAQVRAAIASGSVFVFAKATQGVSGVDSSHAQHIATAKAGKVRPGHYHFAQTCSQASAEAAHFLTVAQPQPGDLLALDLEAMDGSWAQRADYAKRWLGIVQAATHAKPFWYVNKSWWAQLHAALGAWPLWIATGGIQAGQPGISGWTLHQYSTAGGIDHDYAAPGVNLAAFAVPVPVVIPPDPPPPQPIPTPTPSPGTKGSSDMAVMYLRALDAPVGVKGHVVLIEGGKQVKLNAAHGNGFSADGVPYANTPDAAQDAIYDRQYGPVGT